MSIDYSATLMYGWDITDFLNNYRNNNITVSTEEFDDFFKKFQDFIHYQSNYFDDSSVIMGITLDGTEDIAQIPSNLFDYINDDDIDELKKISEKFTKITNNSLKTPKFYLMCEID